MKEKIKSLEELLRICEKARKAGKRIVWTNGCYDIRHAGHVMYHATARRLGEFLLVGLDSVP